MLIPKQDYSTHAPETVRGRMRNKLVILLCAFAYSACGPKAGSFIRFGQLPITTDELAALDCESGGNWAKSDITGTRIVISGVLAQESFARLTNMVGNGSVSWRSSPVATTATVVNAAGACQERVLAPADTPLYVYMRNAASVYVSIQVNAENRQFAGVLVNKVRGDK